MYSFKQPKPVESHPPAGTPVQRHAAQTLVLPIEEAVLESSSPLSAAAAVVTPFALHFLVRYSLREYILFMWQHAGYLIRRRRVGAVLGHYLRIKSTIKSALHFMLLRRGSRTYDMTIDAHGIVRASPSGVTLIKWGDVRLIRRYRQGFLMVLKHGTLPIPYRCLSTDQIAALRGFAATFKA